MSEVRNIGQPPPAATGNTASGDERAPLSPPLAEAIAVAEQHSQAGRLPEAEALCRDILRTQPDCAPALHLLGIVTYQAGNLPSATRWRNCSASWRNLLRLLCNGASAFGGRLGSRRNITARS